MGLDREGRIGLAGLVVALMLLIGSAACARYMAYADYGHKVVFRQHTIEVLTPRPGIVWYTDRTTGTRLELAVGANGKIHATSWTCFGARPAGGACIPFARPATPDQHELFRAVQHDKAGRSPATPFIDCAKCPAILHI